MSHISGDENGGSGLTAETPGTPPDAVQQLVKPFLARAEALLTDEAALAHWLEVARRLQAMWVEFLQDCALNTALRDAVHAAPVNLMTKLEPFREVIALAGPNWPGDLRDKTLALWLSLLGQYGIGSQTSADEPAPWRQDPRFADPAWRAKPVFALIHQTYLLLAEELEALASLADDKASAKRTIGLLIDALNPANIPLTNPVALARAMQTGGESLVQEFEHMLGELRHGHLPWPSVQS